MLNYHQIIEDLKKQIHGDIVFDKKSLVEHSKDASLFTVMPQVIIYPKDKFDIQVVVKYIFNLKSENLDNEFVKKLSITARAAGTCMSGGSLNDSIVLDVTKFMGKIDNVKNNTIICEPGVYFRDLEKVLNTQNLMFPSYPASKDLCCVGGIVANNSAGEKTLLYGQTKDWLEEIEMVLENGEIYNFKIMSFKEFEGLENTYIKKIFSDIFKLIKENKDLIEKNRPKVSKNSSGYNLWEVVDFENETVNLNKLICGSQGTLGIITKVKLRLVEKKKFSQMVTIFLPNLNQLVPVVEEVLKFRPESFESFDDHTFVVAMRFLPSILWKMKGSVFQLGLSFIPEMWMALTGGIPKLILMAEFTGLTQNEANIKAKKCLKQIQNFPYKSRITTNEIDLSKYWTFRRESFNLLRSKLRGFKTAPFVEDVIVPVENMREFIPQMQNILDNHKFTYTIAGHAGNGNFHIIPLMKLNSKEEIEIIKETNLEIFALVEKYHGSISAEHNDGLVRTPYLHFMFDEKMLRIFSSTKEIFDRYNTFNPGKKVGGSISENYAKIVLN